jgi:ABC-type transporter Mla MlaB component
MLDAASTDGVIVIDHPIGDVPRLCERLRAVLERSDAAVVVCDVGALAADAVTVEALARLQLTACRRGRRIRLQRASHELRQLLSLVGLADVLGCGPELGLRPSRQAEEREHPRRVEERVDRGDAAL